MDPVLAWLDLCDARLQAGDDGKATAAYKTFLELAPKHGRAAELQRWIAKPSAQTRPKPTRAAAGACTGCR